MTPSTSDVAQPIEQAALALFDQMIRQQREKVLRLAREAVPHISSEDVLNPNDYPALKAHPSFDYEDGILAGLLSAQMAFRAELGRRRAPGPGVR